MIRDHLPQQHRDFYPLLPLVFIGSLDRAQRSWASVLWGEPGFLRSPDPYTLSITATPHPGDPLGNHLNPGAPLGILGLEFHSRRRNRLNGKLTQVSANNLTVAVDQTFGNCPAYIQAQIFAKTDSRAPNPQPHASFESLEEKHRTLIARSQNFFIASAHTFDPTESASGVDVSYRGGRPGFVHVTSNGHPNRLLFPDFKGNNHFNTLGNILMNPSVGLLFIDFETGDLLSLTGTADIIWEGPLLDSFRGAQRLVQVAVTEGVFLEAALPLRQHHSENAPQLSKTGTWQEVKKSSQAHSPKKQAEPFPSIRTT